MIGTLKQLCKYANLKVEEIQMQQIGKTLTQVVQDHLDYFRSVVCMELKEILYTTQSQTLKLPMNYGKTMVGNLGQRTN